MPKEVEYPQVTEIQVEIWLGDPVTKTFIQCLDWSRLDAQEQAGSGELVDSSSADLTHALLHRSLGLQDAYTKLSDPGTVLEYYEMISHPPPPEDEDEQSN